LPNPKDVLVSLAAGLAMAGSTSAQTLYDNGPVNTVPTGSCVPNGESSSQLQTVGGVSDGLYGIGHMLSVNANERIADDFTVPGPGWTISTIDVYDYQTAAPITSSPITGINVQIWNGQPGTPGATVIYGDMVTNRLLLSVFWSAYRIGSVCDLRRGLFRNTLSINVTLPPGTYWLDWQTIGSPNFNGPWSPLVTIAGQLGKPGANSIQSLDGGSTWDPVTDDGPSPGGNTPVAQDIPFVIHGVTACAANCDGSTQPPILNANDFQCFLNKFAAGDPGANCDGSTQPPILNANDFQCFLNLYAAGCS
jgi:hypothetical protein